MQKHSWLVPLIALVCTLIVAYRCLGAIAPPALSLSVSAIAPVAAASHQPRIYVVNQNHPRANDRGAATETRPLRTINQAAQLAQPGDTIRVHAGVYRERITPARGGEADHPITYEAAAGETVVVKGSEIWQPDWQPVAGYPGVYLGNLTPELFGNYNPYQQQLIRGSEPARPATGSRLPRTLGQIFVNGQPYNEVETMAELLRQPETWLVTPLGDGIYVHFSEPSQLPASQLVELTVRDRLFAPHQRGLGYITLQGFIFEHCANQFPSWGEPGFPQMGAVSTRSGHHWQIAHNQIRYAKTIGLDCGSEGTRDLEGTQPRPERVGYHRIHHNQISDNGLCGIAGWRHVGTQILNNIVERNNFLGFKEGQWEQGGIKLHAITDGLVANNLVRDNDAYGIWLDNRWYGTRVTRNLVVNNLMAGIFVEMGTGQALIDNNVVAYTRNGDGFYAHDASGVTVAHNLFYGNAGFGAWMQVATDRQVRRQDGQRETVTASHNRIVNNLILGNFEGAISLPFPFARAQDNLSDYNLISGGGRWGSVPVFASNTSGDRVTSKTLVAALDKALRTQAVSATDRPNLKLWSQRPLLTLDQWQWLSGNDRHSLLTRLQRPMFRSRILDLELELDKTLWQLGSQPVSDSDRDYFGTALPKQKLPLAGPFQNLQPGYNRFVLWPFPENISRQPGSERLKTRALAVLPR